MLSCQHYYYLLVDVFTLLFPIIYSFHPKLKFYLKFKTLTRGAIPIVMLFLAWDWYFTKMGYWGFNPTYVLGFYVFNLPIEEVLFFICIPFASLFTIHCLALLLPAYLQGFQKYIQGFQSNKPLFLPIMLSLFSLFMVIMYWRQNYPRYTFILLLCLLLLTAFTKGGWHFLKEQAIGYLIVLVPFFIVNGILTGAITPNPIVWYNANQMIGLRLVTIPIEDVFYGFDLLYGIALCAHLFNFSRHK